jgi:hypothetical protein
VGEIWPQKDLIKDKSVILGIKNPVFSPQDPVFCSLKTDWVCWSGCEEIPVTYWVCSLHVTTIPQTYWDCFGAENFYWLLTGYPYETRWQSLCWVVNTPTIVEGDHNSISMAVEGRMTVSVHDQTNNNHRGQTPWAVYKSVCSVGSTRCNYGPRSRFTLDGTWRENDRIRP